MASVPTRCAVTFDFKASNMDELTLEVGQRVQVSQMPDGGWWEGTVVGKVHSVLCHTMPS